MKCIEEWGEKDQEEKEKMNEKFWKTRKRRKKDRRNEGECERGIKCIAEKIQKKCRTNKVDAK